MNVASVGGRTVFPFYSLYHATKWAVEGFSESLQYELEPFNIRVRIIEPGPIKTDFYTRSEEVLKKDRLSAYDKYSEGTIENMKRFGAAAPDGTIVAQAIYDAVTDTSKRLRYGVNTKGLLALRRMLPESAFRLLTRTIFMK